MFRRWKSFRLKRAYAQVQDYASRKRVWGNNIVTLITMNQVINDYYTDLFDSERFMELKKNAQLQSSFSNLTEMVLWLSDVRQVMKESAQGTKVELSGVNAHLNITKQHDVSMVDFLTKDGYPVNLNETFKNMTRIITDINTLLGSVNSNQRQYFDLRLGNGLNTVLVFHEQILEVMINE